MEVGPGIRAAGGGEVDGQDVAVEDERIEGDLLGVRTVIHERDSALNNTLFGFVVWLRVSRGKQTLTLRFNGTIQSQMLLSSPASLLLSYTRTMR
jgi:hypothetical protein